MWVGRGGGGGTISRLFFLSCEKNILDVGRVHTSYDEYIAMVKTGNECQLSTYMLFVGNIAIAVCCAEVLF